jgi:hypothetical protein
MIFDDDRMRALRRKYADKPDYQVPKIVGLDRIDEFAGERAYLETLIRQFPDPKRTDLLGKLLQDNEGQHIGAWFELMLFGWLKENQKGWVLAEPNIEGDAPDFALITGSTRIAIEARAYLVAEDQRAHRKREYAVLDALGSIQRPYAVMVEELDARDGFDLVRLKTAVEEWLDSPLSPLFAFQDASGSKLILSMLKETSSTHVLTAGPIRNGDVNPDRLKPPLKEKASQHKGLRKAGLPYIIALYLEPWDLSAEEVVSAWFGREQVVVDTKTLEIVEVRTDRKGIHYYPGEIRHRSVSATLVFKRHWDAQLPEQYLRSWFLQNPYANVVVSREIFNVVSAYIVTAQDEDRFSMGWRPRDDESHWLLG